jgi:aspartyl-tRNA(Asn)/glutamyl-tRNA(Gln) amidotransferase subunit C
MNHYAIYQGGLTIQMAITNQQLEHIVRLVYLDIEDVTHQFDQCRALIETIEHLQTVDTTNISPLHHPTSVTQYLRPDSHVIMPNIADLEKSASAFVDHFYTVPLILKGA